MASSPNDDELSAVKEFSRDMLFFSSEGDNEQNWLCPPSLLLLFVAGEFLDSKCASGGQCDSTIERGE